MKKIFLLILLFGTLEIYSQDTVRIKKIDQLVKNINNSNFKTQTDSLVQDFPQYKLWMRTYITILTDSTRLKKYTNNVISKRDENGVLTEMVSVSSFYFDQGKLIKVEESIVEDGEKKYADWYYADDKPLYYTLKNERSEERATLLLEMSRNMLKLIYK